MLQLVGHDVAQLGQPQRRPDVVVRADDQLIGDGGRRAVGIRVEDRDPIAHRACRLAEHPPELAAAQDADDRRRRER